MNVDLIVVLAFAYIFAYTSETEALPAEKEIGSMKEIKEPKDIKEAATASKDIKDAIKAAKKNKKDCARECGEAYDPICAHDPTKPTEKPRTFGTQCALDVHNCEMGANLTMKQKGECPGSGGVRLS